MKLFFKLFFTFFSIFLVIAYWDVIVEYLGDVATWGLLAALLTFSIIFLMLGLVILVIIKLFRAVTKHLL